MRTLKVLFFVMFVGVLTNINAANCKDTLEWMATSNVSPATDPCTTWTPDTNWAPYQQTNSWSWHIPDYAVTKSAVLRLGDSTNPFGINSLSLAFITADWATESKRDGWIVEVSTDGTAWSNVTSVGGVLTPGYGPTMTGGALRGFPAYSGSGSSRIKLDLRGSSLNACTTCRFRVRFESDSSIGVTNGGVWIEKFEWWNSAIDPPNSCASAGDNTSVTLSWDTTMDPRFDHAEVWDNGTKVGNFQPPVQFTGLPNGAGHSMEARNYASDGTFAGTSCIPAPVTPSCTGKPAETLLLLSKGGSGTDVVGNWVQQRAEVPCASTPGPVDNYVVSRATGPNGPWTVIASGGTAMVQFNNSVLGDNNTYFYRVLSSKNGVQEAP